MPTNFWNRLQCVVNVMMVVAEPFAPGSGVPLSLSQITTRPISSRWARPFQDATEMEDVALSRGAAASCKGERVRNIR